MYQLILKRTHRSQAKVFLFVFDFQEDKVAFLSGTGFFKAKLLCMTQDIFAHISLYFYIKKHTDQECLNSVKITF